MFARWYAKELGGRLRAERLGGRIVLDADETDDLAQRIDAQAEGRALLVRCARLTEHQRSAIKLVDLAGLTPKEAARGWEYPPAR